MIKKLRELIHTFIEDDENQISEEEEKRLAIYGILYEAARSDHDVAPEEEQKLEEIMERYFSMSKEEYERVKKEAEILHINSTDMFRITREVKSHLSREERLTLMDELWEIAFADGVLDPQETVILRRLADLLGLEHKEFIDSKLKVASKKE